MNRKYTLLTFLLLYVVVGAIGLFCLFSAKNNTDDKGNADTAYTTDSEIIADSKNIASADTATDTENTADSQMGADSEGNSDSEENPEPVTETSSDSEENSELVTETISDSEKNSEQITKTNADSEENSDSDTETSSDSEENSEVDSEPDVTIRDFPDSPIGTFTVNENALRLHTKPSFDSTTLIYLKKGSTGDIFWQDDNWIGISYKKYKGFVAAEYVTTETKKNGD